MLCFELKFKLATDSDVCNELPSEEDGRLIFIGPVLSYPVVESTVIHQSVDLSKSDFPSSSSAFPAIALGLTFFGGVRGGEGAGVVVLRFLCL